MGGLGEGVWVHLVTWVPQEMWVPLEACSWVPLETWVVGYS